jgi:uncharacterized cupredoxin-like copper-binding protein
MITVHPVRAVSSVQWPIRNPGPSVLPNMFRIFAPLGSLRAMRLPTTGSARTISVALLVFVLIAGCSEEGGSTLGKLGDAAEVDRTIELTADEFNFTPDSLDIDKGETIEFVITNEGQSQHEFALGSEHAHQSGMEHDSSTGGTGAITPGEERTLVWTFTEAGETGFACYIAGHNEQGMTGTISVSE